MTTDIDEFRNSLVAAVQAELERHASAVVAEVDRLRDEGRRERAELRAELTEQLGRLSQSIDEIDARSAGHADKVRTTLEQRLDESEKRQTRRIDDATSGLDQMVQQAARPVLADLRTENDELAKRVTSLDANLRRFDEQAARMVTYFNEVTQQVEAKQEALVETVTTDVAGQISVLKQLVDENDSAVRKFQNEVGQQVTQRLNDAEDRLNQRLLQSENRVKEESGQKIAEIDLHVSRVSGNLDESLHVMNDRLAALDDRFVELGRRIDEVAESVEGIDQQALDEMREKMSTAAGEAMLVRIEMERFEGTVNERTDQLAVRLTEVETNLQDATMDVSTAVQLDRLETIERALAELDPDQFVRKDGNDAPPSAIAPPSMLDGGTSESEAVSPDLFVMQDTSGSRDSSPPAPASSESPAPAPAAPPPPPPVAAEAPALAVPMSDPAPAPGGGDEEPHLPGGIDIAAIIAAAEAANDHEK